MDLGLVEAPATHVVGLGIFDFQFTHPDDEFLDRVAGVVADEIHGQPRDFVYTEAAGLKRKVERQAQARVEFRRAKSSTGEGVFLVLVAEFLKGGLDQFQRQPRSTVSPYFTGMVI
jgi:hypothetical protein